MKTTVLTSLIATVAIILNFTPAVADGLIDNLPPDGSWIRYETTGEGRKPGGAPAVSAKGMLTLKSVGQETCDGIVCRWIEIETKIEFQRGEEKGMQAEIYKFLIPEKYLTRGENPRDHVLKAWRKDRKGVIGELDMKGDGAKIVESLNELFHARLSETEKPENVEIKTPAGTFRGTKVDAHETFEPSGFEISTQTWLTDDVPFGVAAYRHTVVRNGNGVPMDERWMELKAAEFGKDAKSALGK